MQSLAETEESFASTDKNREQDDFERVSPKFDLADNLGVNMYDKDIELFKTQGRKLTEVEMTRSLISRENDTKRIKDDSFNRAVSTREMSVEEHVRGS